MPELPEVEITKRGLEPSLINQIFDNIFIYQENLRWPIQKNIKSVLRNKKILSLSRRGKYLLINLENGSLIIHLGMSGSLKFLSKHSIKLKHDHVIFRFCSGSYLTFNDPRRFGSIHFSKEPNSFWLIKNLGVEPLSDEFNIDFLWKKCKKSKSTIKQLLMNHKVVVGVGNIYASESLFYAGINPRKIAHKISKKKLVLLITEIKTILSKAIKLGGSSIRDFTNSNGKMGYFQQSLVVYNRENEPCVKCNTKIKRVILGQRSSFYCYKCQK
ncbi:MAG: bifunctional DNA-formamidopyrimidine glycosylase/DNA-(apurinic or apyrimidinic site) lyase [Pseudomonadota bacterium]|nr:DNA-formamidopyrimidine glycosylase [Gammaproteobacteria bacterium]MEE2684313.1 bifunctional DNA-formamidopyrimidine glycosylase/DNA-(apurinic or apyrimidinic site) lyase [Pseudomonadota bacterium]|tara:strand:- start:2161 stop:2973 length:813 start_codon:yes stop_codon:yes gene_type:complete